MNKSAGIEQWTDPREDENGITLEQAKEASIKLEIVDVLSPDARGRRHY